VPAISLGGIGIGVLQRALQINIIDTGAWGCVIGSFVLFYLAYMKPRRDIVSLFTPLFAVIIFVLPSELQSSGEGISWLVLQIAFALSISILALRVEKWFSQPRTRRQWEDEDEDEEEDDVDEEGDVDDDGGDVR